MTGPMSPADPMGRSGAAWCEIHSRWECSRKSKRSHTRCHASAIRGLDACRSHAGTSTEVAKAKGAAVTAWAAMSADGAPVGNIDPGAAVLGVLHMSWLRLHVLAGLLEDQVGRDGLDAGIGTEDPGDDGALGEGGTSGLVGHTYGAAKDVGIYASGEAVRALAQLEASERERVVRFAKAAHDMGIADREVRVLEAQAAQLAGVIRAVVSGLLDRAVGALDGEPGARRVIEGQWSSWAEAVTSQAIEPLRAEVVRA